MPETKIHYAILALTINNVNEVISFLDEKGGYNLVINWLKNNKDRYGELPENWKPFGDKEINNIIKEKPEEYHSETHLINEYFNNVPEALDLSGIDVLFIDIFSLYRPEYTRLAKENDQLFCSALSNKCCFLIDYTLPHELQLELENKYVEFWPRVSQKYRDGCLHRVAARIDDLRNFRNFLTTIVEMQDLPDSKTKAIVYKTKFRDHPDKPIPNLS